MPGVQRELERAIAAESCAAVIASTRASAELAGLVDRMEEAVETEDIGAYYPLNCEFHTLIVACADNHKLNLLWPNLESELHLYRRRGLVLPGSLRVSNYDHRAMVAALRAGDAAAAERIMEQHIHSGKARLLKTVTSTTSEPGTPARWSHRLRSMAAIMTKLMTNIVIDTRRADAAELKRSLRLHPAAA